MKKPLFILLGSFALGVLFLTSCGGDSSTSEKKSEAKSEVVTGNDKVVDLGEKIYNEKCIVCHMANGEGMTGAFPSLKDSDLIREDKKAAVAQALNGSPGGSTIKGVHYSAPMPPQVDTKEEAIAVINYVSNHFGNDFGTITLDEVEDVVIDPR
ncbi:MAG: c-type cytochrome [Bacteroidales bacterium]|jgi:mono/diheme cytochrome c family protein|nr:c-type cytochrome [Bacteroidales bacterium]MCK9447465.1 c-type cytochrome [Bacteroidales bacterium]MDD3700661.1 c-type cytochrome [Bacteroidales bacterium]MDY0368216.1 c-type cytochrome [Bacteroidales bacterium]